MSLNKKNCHTDDNGCLCFSGGKQDIDLEQVFKGLNASRII